MNLDHLLRKVIEFNKHVMDSEIDFEPGCRAKVIAWELEEDDVLKLTLDFKEYEEYNKQFLTPNYYDKDRKPTLYWYEMGDGYYPKNCRDTYYFDPHDIDTPKNPFTVLETDPAKDLAEKVDKITLELCDAVIAGALSKNSSSIREEFKTILKKHLQ